MSLVGRIVSAGSQDDTEERRGFTWTRCWFAGVEIGAEPQAERHQKKDFHARLGPPIGHADFAVNAFGFPVPRPQRPLCPP